MPMLADLPADARIVVLTGAGISAESGIPTFRDRDGIWARVRIEDVATPEAFARDPARVHAFYNERRRALQSPQIRPNPAHEALARLERHWPGAFLLVTQNIDDLHERAGSRRLVHMHGELLKALCSACGARHRWTGDLGVDDRCPACGERGSLRPDVVWFGEMPYHMPLIEAELRRCQLFVAVGTSGQVYPAAGFVEIARASGALCVELNLEPSAVSEAFHHHRYGRASELVPAFVDELLLATGKTV